MTFCLKENQSNEYIVKGPPPVLEPSGRSIGVLLMERMARFSQRIAQIDASDGTVMTYTALRTQSIRVAQALQQRGVAKRDIVTICSRNFHNVFPAAIGVVLAGAVLSPLDVDLGIADMKHILQTTLPKLIFCENAVVVKLRKGVAEINLQAEIIVFDKDDVNNFERQFLKETGNEDSFAAVDVGDIQTAIAFLMASSGTTGLPKSIIITHTAMIYLIINVGGLECGDRDMSFASLYWITGVISLMQSTWIGATRVFTHEHYTKELNVKIIENYKLNRLTLPPEYMNLLRPHAKKIGADLSSIKRLHLAGSICTVDNIIEMDALLPNGFVNNIYAMTEVGLISSTGKEIRIANCVGKLSSGQCKIIDLETKQPLRRNQEGEIFFKPDVDFAGYFKNQEATLQILDEHGFCGTGDIGYFDEDSRLYLVDRVKNMLRTYMGFFTSPSQIETEVLKIQGVQNVAVVGVVDDVLADVPVAFVVKLPGATVTEQDIQDHVADKLADYQRLLGGVIFIDDLPMTPSGKVKRSVLRERAERHYVTIKDTIHIH